MKVKVAQSCLTLCDPMDYIVHGILLARILDWVPKYVKNKLLALEMFISCTYIH